MVLQVQMATELSSASAQLASLQLELLYSVTECYMVLQVQMATELSSASAQLATLQLELGELRKKEGELRQQLQSSSSTSIAHKEELERLRLQTTGHTRHHGLVD